MEVSSPACPTLYPYSKADQAQAAQELETLPDGSVVLRMIGDYAVVREQIRACL